MERVPAGAQFNFTIIYDLYNDDKEREHLNELMKAFRLLEDDYLGGSGTRGYGRVCFKDIVIKRRTINDYYKQNPQSRIEQDITSEYWINAQQDENR
jgi:CRISPR-associated protein Csm3